MSSIDDTRRAGRGAFFGRRQGHKLRPHQAELFQTLLPRLAIGADPIADLAALFAVPVDEMRLEIGFGGGEHLIAEAQRYPHVGFVGVEPFVNGMAKALAAIDALKLANVRLHFDDATTLLPLLPPRSLSRVDLLYPDPWPKRRHWKRRFVQPQTIAAIARVLKPDGLFRFVSDWPGYVAWTLARMMRSPEFEWLAECADDWRRPWPRFTETRYQAKAVREGRIPCYLAFRRR